MIEYAARLLRFADELEEGAHPRASLLRHGVEAVLTLVGSMDRDASMAGHEGPSSTDADELRHQGDKVIQFACALGFDAVDEACDSEEEITTSAAPAAPTRRKRRLEARRLSNKSPRRLGFEGDEEEEEEEEVGAGAPDEGGDQRESLLRQLDTRPDWFLNCERGEATPENIDRARRLLIEQPDSLLRVVNSATNKAIYRGKETKTSQLTDQALREVVRSTGLPEIGLVKLLAANDGRPSAVERRLMDAATTEGVFGLLRVMTEDGAQLRLHEGTDVFHPDVMSSYDGVIVIHELACGQFRRRQFDDPCATVLTGAVWRSWCAVSPLASPQVTYNRSGGGCAKDAQPTTKNTRLEGRCTPTARYTQQVQSTLDTVDRAVVAAAAKSWPNRRAIAIMQSGDVGPSNADQQIRAIDISSQHNLPAGSVWSVRVNHLSLDLGQDTKPAESTARGLVNLSEATRLPGEEGLSRGEKEVAIGDLMLRFGVSFAEKEARVPGEEDVAWSTSHRQRVDRMRGGYGGGLENARTIMAEVGPELLRKKTLGFEARQRGGQEAHRKRKAEDPLQYSRDQGAFGRTGGRTGGADRGPQKGRTGHARGGSGTRRSITLANDILRPRPDSVESPAFQSFKCPEGCGRVDAIEDRWFYDILHETWKYVGPVCQNRVVHSVAEMVPCRDAEGGDVYGDKDMKKLPFVGNNRASKVVRDHQDAYKAWLEEEAARSEEDGTETEPDIEFDDWICGDFRWS